MKKVVIKASKQPVEGSTHIMCYDDTNNFVQAVCEELDMTEPEFIDFLIEEACNSNEQLNEIYNRFYL